MHWELAREHHHFCLVLLWLLLFFLNSYRGKRKIGKMLTRQKVVNSSFSFHFIQNGLILIWCLREKKKKRFKNFRKIFGAKNAFFCPMSDRMCCVSHEERMGGMENLEGERERERTIRSRESESLSGRESGIDAWVASFVGWGEGWERGEELGGEKEDDASNRSILEGTRGGLFVLFSLPFSSSNSCSFRFTWDWSFSFFSFSSLQFSSHNLEAILHVRVYDDPGGIVLQFKKNFDCKTDQWPRTLTSKFISSRRFSCSFFFCFGLEMWFCNVQQKLFVVCSLLRLESCFARFFFSSFSLLFCSPYNVWLRFFLFFFSGLDQFLLNCCWGRRACSRGREKERERENTNFLLHCTLPFSSQIFLSSFFFEHSGSYLDDLSNQKMLFRIFLSPSLFFFLLSFSLPWQTQPNFTCLAWVFSEQWNTVWENNTY